MNITLRYPLYLAPLDGGYASVVDPQADESAAHHLAVFTTDDLASAFMLHCEILGVSPAVA